MFWIPIAKIVYIWEKSVKCTCSNNTWTARSMNGKRELCPRQIQLCNVLSDAVLAVRVCDHGSLCYSRGISRLFFMLENDEMKLHRPTRQSALVHLAAGGYVLLNSMCKMLFYTHVFPILFTHSEILETRMFSLQRFVNNPKAFVVNQMALNYL